MDEAQTNSSFRDGAQRLFLWARTNKVKALSILLSAFFLFEVVSIPWFGITDLKTENPSETALMRQRLREAEDDDMPLTIRSRWIPLSRIPRHVINAVVVAEDGTFWEHGGFDWYEFQQSVKKNWEKKRAVRGASTITQQLAKNLYLSTSKDPIRKLKEWLITYLIEQNLDKNRILEIYLNVIEWGRGVFGIEAAAQTYYRRSASSLSLDQAVRLAAVIPSPLKHKPTDNSRWVLFRRNVVSQRMQGRRYLDFGAEPEEDEAEKSEEGVSPKTEKAPVPPADSVGQDELPAAPDNRDAPVDTGSADKERQ